MSYHVNKMVTIKISLEREIEYIKDTLTQKKEHLKIINDFIKEYCQHQWVNDYIDTGVEKGMNITYCKQCELTK